MVIGEFSFKGIGDISFEMIDDVSVKMIVTFIVCVWCRHHFCTHELEGSAVLYVALLNY